jgi:hypothetical protein
VQDQGYEFYFSWFLVLVVFVAWKMLEGAVFPEVEPSNPLAIRFSILWYMNDMSKKWKSNIVFHSYYQQLKDSIESFPCMTPCTLHQYRPLAKVHVDPHFIYITTHIDESKEELQSCYKMSNKDMEQIMKEWPTKFLVPIDDAELSDPEIIESPLATRFEHAGQTSVNKKKEKEEVQNIETDEEDNALEESRPGSPAGGGGDQINQEGGEEEGEK